jgi:indolepyruvate ferredoxin oxidoreductase
MTVFKLLARLKGLRGGVFDLFGHSAERRQERAWLDQYQTACQETCDVLAAGPHAVNLKCYQNALTLALIPQDIRGFGHIKTRHMALAMEKWRGLLTAFRARPVA